MKTTINLQDELIAENRKALAADQAVLAKQAALDVETDKLVDAALDRATADYEASKQKTLETLGLSYKLAEAKQVREKQSKGAHLPQERIFTKDAIKELCLKYNLRFLPTSYYKGALDSQLPDKVEELRKANGGLLPGEKAPVAEVKIGDAQDTDGYFGGDLGVVPTDKEQRQMAENPWSTATTFWMNSNMVFGRVRSGISSLRGDHAIGSFCIAAPAESFDLQPRPIDPLLFCNLGDDQYYLVHKWGSDISWSRRWLKHWRSAAHKCLSVVLVLGLAGLGSQFGRLFEADAGPFFSFLGFVMGAFFGCLLSFGPPEVFDFITRNSKTTTVRNWDSPYTS